MKFETHFQDIIKRTHDVRSFRFPKPNELDYKPGQFFFVTIRQNQKELTKHFSFSSSPTENNFIEFTKKITDHEFSQALLQVKVGDWARIDAPYGKFTFEGEYPKVTLLAGGIGITPFISMCKNATDKQLKTKITLLYGCRTEEDIAFKKEFEELSQINENLRVVFIVNQPTNEWKGKVGIVNAELVKKELTDYKENIFFTCGPPGMIKAMESLVESLGLPKDQLKTEAFTGYT